MFCKDSTGASELRKEIEDELQRKRECKPRGLVFLPDATVWVNGNQVRVVATADAQTVLQQLRRENDGR